MPGEVAKSLKGKKNIYVCDNCFGHIVTVDRDDGTTPCMLMTCRATDGCKGTMESSFYRVYDQRMAASHEWYLPDASEKANLTPPMLPHVKRFGLLLRAIDSESDADAT